MQEARDSGLIQTLLINGRREYLLQRQQQLFDEVPVRLVLLAPFKGGNVRTKERWRDLSNAGRHPAQKKKRTRGANRRRKPDRDVTYMSVMVAKWSRV